jgi:hypothetical protein
VGHARPIVPQVPFRAPRGSAHAGDGAGLVLCGRELRCRPSMRATRRGTREHAHQACAQVRDGRMRPRRRRAHAPWWASQSTPGPARAHENCSLRSRAHEFEAARHVPFTAAHVGWAARLLHQARADLDRAALHGAHLRTRSLSEPREARRASGRWLRRRGGHSTGTYHDCASARASNSPSSQCISCRCTRCLLAQSGAHRTEPAGVTRGGRAQTEAYSPAFTRRPATPHLCGASCGPAVEKTAVDSDLVVPCLQLAVAVGRS